jgi:hypothetical protein
LQSLAKHQRWHWLSPTLEIPAVDDGSIAGTVMDCWSILRSGSDSDVARAVAYGRRIKL